MRKVQEKVEQTRLKEEEHLLQMRRTEYEWEYKLKEKELETRDLKQQLLQEKEGRRQDSE